MKRLYQHTVQHPKLIVILFLMAAIVCAGLRNQVSVNYDMTDYLPEDAPSTVSLDVMQEEFDGAIPNARVMVRDVSLSEAQDIKRQIKQCTGVTDVTWLDDTMDLSIPLDFMDTDTVETYYKDGNALFSVTIAEDDRIQAVDEIRAVIGDGNAMTGDMVSSAIATRSTEQEIRLIAVFGVSFVFLVLLLTLNAWIEPFIVLIGLGVAVLINAGSNLMFGEISFVTNAAGSILQLAVSLDYSVFLMHRFEECRQEVPDSRQAMANALTLSTNSILSSGLTTVIGFLALIFMRFQIGPDLGLALAKGVSISLITVFLFTPSLILLMEKWIIATRHRSFVPSFARFGRAVRKAMLPLVCVFVFIVIPSYHLSNCNSFYYGSSHIFGKGTQLGEDTAAVEDIFGKQDTYVVLVPNGDLQREKQLSNALHELPEVNSILSRVDYLGPAIPQEFLKSDLLSKLESERYTRMVLTVEAETDSEKTFALVKTIRDTISEVYPEQSYLVGEGVSTCDLRDTITQDMKKVNLIAIGAVFLVLMLTLKSVTLPVILVLSIETAIWINLTIPYVQGKMVFYISYLIISSIQLGATVDYAILYTDRYLDYRKQMGRRDAIAETTAAVTVSMLTSGTVLMVVGFLLGFVSSHGILAQLGMFLGFGSLLSLLIVLFVLPGLLFVLDRAIEKTTLKARFYRKE